MKQVDWVVIFPEGDRFNGHSVFVFRGRLGKLEEGLEELVTGCHEVLPVGIKGEDELTAYMEGLYPMAEVRVDSTLT